MSKVVSVRLKDEQFERLQRQAQRLGRTPAQSVTLMLEEALRECEHPYVEFKDTAVGRDAFLRGTRLKIWMIRSIADEYAGDIAKTAEHLSEPTYQIEAALQYAEAYREEIERAIAENHRSVDELRRILPNLAVFTVHDDDEPDEDST